MGKGSFNRFVLVEMFYACCRCRTKIAATVDFERYMLFKNEWGACLTRVLNLRVDEGDRQWDGMNQIAISEDGMIRDLTVMGKVYCNCGDLLGFKFSYVIQAGVQVLTFLQLSKLLMWNGQHYLLWDGHEFQIWNAPNEQQQQQVDPPAAD